MKKDKKFLEELASFLGDSKHKDEIVAKYDDFIKSEKKNGKKIKEIIKGLGDPEEVATKELEVFKNEKVSFSEKFNKFIKSLKKDKTKEEKKETKDSKKKEKKKEEVKEEKEKKPSIFAKLKEKSNSKEEKKEKKEKKVKEEKKKEDKPSILDRFKAFLTKERTIKKREVTDSPKEIVEEVKEEVEDKISDVAEIVSETHIFEPRSKRIKRAILRTIGVMFTCILVFIWLWASVVFFAAIFAYLDGIKFEGIIICLFGADLLILWLVIMINRAIFRKKMSLALNLIIIFLSVALIAIGAVMAFREIKDIDYVQDVSEKYTMTRKLETYELPKESNEKFIITFNSNYKTQYVIQHDKNIKGKVKIETRYYEVYYDYYTKTSTNGVYVSLKLDDRDRFSVYLDDLKEGKIYDNDELARYTVKITVNPNEASKLAIQ